MTKAEWRKLWKSKYEKARNSKTKNRISYHHKVDYWASLETYLPVDAEYCDNRKLCSISAEDGKVHCGARAIYGYRIGKYTHYLCARHAIPAVANAVRKRGKVEWFDPSTRETVHP